MLKAGAMANLKELDLQIYLYNYKFVVAGSDFEYGIQKLPNLAQILVIMYCIGTRATDVGQRRELSRAWLRHTPHLSHTRDDEIVLRKHVKEW